MHALRIVTVWFTMFWVAWRLAWPYPLTPWRSPLLRWRLETYGLSDETGRLLHADAITHAHFLRFVFQNRSALLRFLRWAACL